LHEKLDVSLVYARSLEAQLKAPIPTIYSTCEINVVKNMELAQYVDHLPDENDELRKLTKEYITFGDNGKGRVLSVGTVKVSECDSSACFSCQVFGLQSSLCLPAS
jgi:hypothetical protein